MVVITTKLYKAIAMVGANACATLGRTLLVVGFYFIGSFLAMWRSKYSAARILKIRSVPVEEVLFYVGMSPPFGSGQASFYNAH